ncbi:RCC1 domain-containing protein [Paenibacillus sp. FSL R7-0273]|uniref:RCC1 domain-containing protein n=1 Tax=Paenibacillus sp. FSL R7-0273 TaxID=1536772 RepID=UPI000693FC01|nr:RCC1 domain-containing protein [Paenibacillus sp. FSL R7-0273]
MVLRTIPVRLMAILMAVILMVPAAGGEAGAEAAVRPVSVSGGNAHGLAVWSDGTVTGWGYNKSGQVGDGTTIDQYVPRQISGLSGIVQVAAGSNASFALDAAGEVWGWGQTYGSYISYDPSAPVQKSGPRKLEGLQNVGSIVTNGYTGLAVKKDGTATLWYPSFDQPSEMSVRYLPLPGVTGIKSAVIAGNDALFLTEAGAVKQLSIYNTVYGRVRWASDPVTVHTLTGSGIKQIAASGDNAFLLDTSGRVLRWNRSL